MTLKLICAAALLLATIERDRISSTLGPVTTLPQPRPDKIGAVR